MTLQMNVVLAAQPVSDITVVIVIFFQAWHFMIPSLQAIVASED